MTVTYAPISCRGTMHRCAVDLCTTLVCCMHAHLQQQRARMARITHSHPPTHRPAGLPDRPTDLCERLLGALGPLCQPASPSSDSGIRPLTGTGILRD